MLNHCDNRLATSWSSRKRRPALYRKPHLPSREIAPAASLLGPYPSAIMRRRLFGAPAAVTLACVLAAAPMAAAAADADSAVVVDSVAEDDGRAAWLPAPEEDFETLEPLAEERTAFHTGFLLRGSIARGRFRMRRVAFQGRRPGFQGQAGFLLDGSRVRPGARIDAGGGRVSVAGGRVSLARLPPLLAGAMRLTSPGRRVPAPRWGAISAEPSLGASAGSIDGAAMSLRGASTLWTFAGARADGSGEKVGGLGAGIRRGSTRLSATLGAVASAARGKTPRPDGRFGSATIVRENRGGSLALEALAGTRGRALLAELTARAEAVLFSARWRYLSWDERRVAAELSAETHGPSSRARITWRSWSRGADSDDGVLEVEAAASPRGMAPMRIRLGAAGLGSGEPRASPREAYGLVEGTVARDAGRSLSLHALRRGSAAGGAGTSSTTVGARLNLRAGPVGDHALLIESTRIRKGAPAWGVALSPSGDVTLRVRSKPGIWITARGGIGAGTWRLGYALERREGAGGQAPWSGSMWLSRNSD